LGKLSVIVPSSSIAPSFLAITLLPCRAARSLGTHLSPGVNPLE
jgi:hypothetical protein